MAHIPKKSILKRTQIIDKKRIQAEKARQEELDENICVIGYASKLFRDDVKALSLHRGEHLIPWQGDSSLMIDRYDVRGHLQSLSDFQTDSWNREYQLSSEEQRIESLCDEERYLALHKDLIEEQHRQEEELKRLNEAIASDEGYNAVAFSYGGNDEYDPMNPTEDETETREENTPPAVAETEAERAATPEPDEEPFIAPEELNVPKGVERVRSLLWYKTVRAGAWTWVKHHRSSPTTEKPATLKTHLIIEKTAMFVCNQGPQMEIIVKAKQANNPQFSFLQFEHYLNPYYKHLVKMIKSKRYRPKPLTQVDQNNGRGTRKRSRSNSGSSHHSDDEDENDSSGYLHPSLLGKPKAIPAASSEMKISASDKQTTTAALVNTSTEIYSTAATTTTTTTSSADYQVDPQIQALMTYMDPASLAAAGYYDPNTGMVNPYLLSQLPPPPPPPPDDSDSSVPAPPYMPFLDPSFMAAPPPPPPGPSLPPHTTTVPLSAPLPPHTTVPPPTGPPSTGPPPTSVPPNTSIPPPPVLDPASSMGLAGSVSHEILTSGLPPHTAASDIVSEPSKVEANNIIPPPPDIQPIIDKLAKYVAKNGEDFEASVRSKADQRFEFLLPWHPFNAYYMQKKRLYLKEMGKDVGELDASVEAQSQVKKGPVSFSIKAKKAEERELEKKSALPIESSDSETEEEKERTNPPMRASLRTSIINHPRGDRASDFKERKGFIPDDRTHFDPEDWRERYPDEDVPPADYGQKQFPVPLPGDKPRKPPIPPEELAFRNSKHRLQDRLAMAARDKMASESKERVLQMERRKKAALFLSMIKDRPQAAVAADVSMATDLGRSSPTEVIDLVDEPDEQPKRKLDTGSYHRKRHSRSSSPPSHHRRHASPPKAFKTIRNTDTDNDGKSRTRARSKSPSRLGNRKRRHISRTPSPHRSSSLSPEYTREKYKSQSPLLEHTGLYPETPSVASRLESPPPVEIDLTNDVKDTPSNTDPAPTDLRSKVRAMLAETRGMVFEPT